MNRDHGSEVESIRTGLENSRNLSSESLRNLCSENLRNSGETSPLGLSNSRINRKHSPPSSTQTFISANEHISNLLQSKKMSESTSDMSVSSVDSSFVSPQNRRKRTTSANLGEFDLNAKGLSRSSSTLSLSTGLPPLDSLLKKLREGLCGKVYSGWYTERRYIDPIERYKDVIVVDRGEAEVIKVIRSAVRRSIKILGENAFVGFAFAEDECRLYVNLGPPTSVAQFPFGHFWFQVRQVTFIQNVGFCLDLSVIRQFMKSDEETCFKCRQRELEVVVPEPVKLDSLGSAAADIKARIEVVMKDALNEYWHPTDAVRSFTPHLNYQNLVKLVKLVCVLMMAMLAGIYSGLKHAGNFMLKTLHELAFIVERSTPLALGTLNILSKVVGGFYLLVAMIWRDSTKPANRGGQGVPGPSPLKALSAPKLPATPMIRSAAYPGTSASQGAYSRASARPSPLNSAMDNMYSSHRNY